MLVGQTRRVDMQRRPLPQLYMELFKSCIWAMQNPQVHKVTARVLSQCVCTCGRDFRGQRLSDWGWYVERWK